MCSFTCDSRACERPLGVTLGTGHACVIVGAPSASAGDEGSIYCFGFNTEGQLGIGSFGGTYTRPTPVSRPRGVVFHHVRTARRHTCAIDQHDEVWCWGANDSGQLGSEGGNEPAPVPVQGPGGVGVLDQVLTLDAGGFYADAERGNWRSFMFRKRDQNVRLTWPHLSFMLRKIDDVKRNATRFSAMFGKQFEYYGGSVSRSTSNAAVGVVYEVLPGHRLPQRHKGADTVQKG